MKKTLALFTAVMMMLSLLSGCQKDLEQEAVIEGKTVQVIFDDNKMNSATIIDGENEYRVEKVEKDITITYPNGAKYFYMWDPDISLWDMRLEGNIEGYISNTDLFAAFQNAK